MLKICLAVLIGVAAIADDIVRRRISNWIAATAMLTGWGLQISAHGWKGLGIALAGSLSGGAVFFIFYLMGGMGGGDIKLMAGFGAMLGANGILAASFWTAGIGGIIAAAAIGAGSLKRIWGKRALPGRPSGAEIGPGRFADSIPYAPAIAAGVWISLAAGA